MTPKHFILATAGHVDHGKSSLVKALTGTDPDRLPEEKARGITIDLGFAHLPLEIRTPELVVFDLGIVDVPGHEDFVKNMVAGVGAIDLALLVVAADDGWMPQTEEHVQILSYLGVKRAVVALTKADLASARVGTVLETVRAKLRQTPFADAQIVRTSVVSGAGLDELKAALVTLLMTAPPPRDIGKPRLPIDRAFTLHGIGTVVTGTLLGGSFQRGQPVVLQPLGKPSRIRTIQSHNRELEVVGPGTRAALSLADVALSDATKSAESSTVRRGQVVTLRELGAASSTLDVVLEKSVRLAGAKTPAARPLKDGTRVWLHHGSGSVPARIAFLDRKEISPGDKALSQLRLDAPIFVLAGDHFIVRDWAEQATLAGGVILNADGKPKGFRTPARQALLQQRADSLGDPVVAVATQLERERIAQRALLLVQSNFSAEEIGAAVGQLCTDGKLVGLGNLVALASWWNGFRQQAAAAIEQHHRAHAEQPGLPLNQLRATLTKELIVPEAFDLLLVNLFQSGFGQVGSAVKQNTHRPALPLHLQTAGAKLRSTLAAKPLDPPSRKELAPDAASQQALRFLIQTGEAVEVGPELVLLAESFGKARDLIKKHLLTQGRATVSELRQALGASRRIVVPVLEKLDRDGVTKREGDFRVLKESVNR